MGSAAGGRGIALLRLDRVADALVARRSADRRRTAGAAVKPDWARFVFPDGSKAAE